MMNFDFGSTVRPKQRYANQILSYILVIGDREQGRATYRLLILSSAYNLFLISSSNTFFIFT